MSPVSPLHNLCSKGSFLFVIQGGICPRVEVGRRHPLEIEWTQPNTFKTLLNVLFDGTNVMHKAFDRIQS